MTTQMNKEITINATGKTVWQALTMPEQMCRWMGEPEMQLSISTSWQVGDPVTIRGMHPMPFENTGKVIEYKPEQRLCYSHLNSISDLPGEPTDYTLILFELKPLSKQTKLSLAMSNFPTDIILKHLDFYWNGTLTLLKQFVEQQVLLPSPETLYWCDFQNHGSVGLTKRLTGRFSGDQQRRKHRVFSINPSADNQ